ncbi:MAG TPA: D-Ala-D-Ala carboxypeptidase family metallohydrolase [Tenuifilaceae bacterium]|nr:D-Ala-D-Ala carboxypeptidase family metallohydrolase [Tenuifilaceae bacterium]
MINEKIARNYKLSENFTLWEFIRSNRADLLGIMGEQYDIPEPYILNLKRLCENVLQPLRNRYGTIHINSGYRSLALNIAIKGAKNSEHMQGKAADIVFADMKSGFEYIKKNLTFRQLINEHDFSWIHVSYDEFDNKKQVLKIG